MPHHKRQLSDADQPRPQPSLSAVALTEIDTALRQVGFTFDDGHVFADHEHAALRLLHLDPRERPYDASEKNVAVRIAMIFEAAHQVASENPGIDARSPEFWQLVKTTALKVDKTFEDAHESDLALCYVIITKFHAAWNRFGREDSETAQKILVESAARPQQEQKTGKKSKGEREVDEYMNSDDYINSNGPVSPQHLKKHLRAFLRLINKQHKRNLVDEYSRGKKEGYESGFTAGAASNAFSDDLRRRASQAEYELGKNKYEIGLAFKEYGLIIEEQKELRVEVKELREEVEELRAEGADKDAKLKQKELEIEETRLALARSDGVDLDEGDVFDDEDDEYGNYEEEIEDKIENED
ncbi:hypothetical protein COL26b_007789 [Colletotrichum chrysophilum]|uniref:uncharacterized protein n=1 Tax=Colletotrichum chrysophilum TaxID=1836956 RepID=UPI0023008A6A|nr:uncharacterized protein COL26b_007789 [Colletotrichum chrysophilum]KAJ0373923.1 hypothetical protein COL26b_007789 [Colletotrichum chrysophilum]